ncbi:MAG: PSD1 and planctomycete cytochrome C domain-containing protein [Verrucomicrobiales bacterium]|nr:PSD1 and planctomycete cytochrome C domain-containing protein [Verrucomicrobiales bacterium]
MSCLLGVVPGFATEVSPDQAEFFEKKIRPLLAENCFRCHDATEKDVKGGLSMHSPSAFRRGGDHGERIIVSGKPEESLLIEAVRYQNRDLQMPPKSPLSESEIRDLETWIEMGAPDPRSEVEDDLRGPTGMDPEEGRNFWSFRPLQKSVVPPGVHPVDHFIQARLAEKSLKQTTPASKETWLRRATFDLTGLPPTPGEIEAFLADETPDAETRVVDRLLASPDYAVRWGRHWLDVARYADSNGLDENLAFANAWRYRDYVISSFNEDKPFDQFLIEQIAGDLIENPDRDTLVATGFLALGARVLAEPDREKLEMDVIDEQLDTMGKAFLGLTLGCARCHDHKFDPILQSDYFSLAAIFRNSRNFAESNTGAIKHWYEHDFSSEEEKERLKPIDEAIAEAKKKARTHKNKVIGALRGEARSKAVDYLVASFEFDASATLATVSEVAGKYDLHPRILYHARRHLDNSHGDKVFQTWWKYREKGDQSGMREFYEEKFETAVLAFSQLQKENSKAKTLPDPELEPYRAALFDNSGLLAVPAKPEHAFSEIDLAEYHRLSEEARLLETEAPDYSSAMGIADGEKIEDTLPIHIRGNHLSPGEEVPRALPAVFGEKDVRFPSDASGRLELARWMADPSNPLTARVIVNRVWRWHFGQGLVSTTENFGVLGERPSHPELLDWMAGWFVENGWSIKKLNRLIMTSDTYRLSSDPLPGIRSEVDPENRLLSHFPVRRLEAEAIRDAILHVSGRLDRESGGKSIPLRNRQMVFNHTSKDHTSYDSLRRTAFLPVVRNHLYDWLHLFDYPDPTMPTGNRASTVIAPQALLLMNSPLMTDSSAAFASRILGAAESTEERVDLAWQLAFGRLPAAGERDLAIEFLAEAPDSPHQWNLFCQSLLASNQFVYLQ